MMEDETAARAREHGERLEKMLDSLEAVPASEREAWLDNACPDAELRREILALLRAEDEADTYLDRLSDDLALARPLFPDMTGKRLGAYRLLRQIGRGGMGVVYQAQRVDGTFDQRVALKLLTSALAGAEGRQRFLMERQILAGLEHPAIARIVDGGVAEDDTPWFAMEYVDGVAIDAYCDRNRLGVSERLELFLQVCDAVEHAHRRLVVHRDLKPANVLVTDGPTRQVKLLDFGIAKLLDTDGSGHAAPATRTALRLMTPEYASPEQVRGESVTTASDVYQLGVLLYELLTGHRPYQLRHRGAAELERAICEQPPTRPATALFRVTGPVGGTTTRTIDEICSARRSSPGRLQRRLRGDLENILLEALRKEPERRYGSADRLAQDIRRHMRGLPVAARPDTWLYRGRKFLRRHALGAAAAGVVLMLAVLATGFYTVRIQSERDRAELERDRAQAETAKAEQMSQFLTGLFRSADPRDGTAADLTARELLDRGVEQVEHDLAALPEVRADMLQVLGRTYLELGLYDSADGLLTRALELRRERLGPGHADVARTLGAIGLLRYQQGRYDEAMEPLQEAIAILEQSSEGDESELPDLLTTMGRAYREQGRYRESRTALERALAIQTRITGADSTQVGTILDSLGLLLVEVGEPKQAEDLYERALAIHERSFEENPLAVGRSLNEVANVRLYLGKLDGLEAMFRRSLEILRTVYGPDHAWVGLSLNNLGNLLIELDRADEALDILKNALALQSKALGPNHPEVAYPLTSLGDAHLKVGNVREARDYYRRSVAIRDSNLHKRSFDPLTVHGLVRLGGIETTLGNRDAAALDMNRAVAIWRHAPDLTDPRLAPTAVELGRWLIGQDRCSEALPLLQRAVGVETIRKDASKLSEIQNLMDDCVGK